MDSKTKTDQLLEKGNLLGDELIRAAKQRETISQLRADLEKIKIILASAERVNAILKGKETDVKLLEMVEEVGVFSNRDRKRQERMIWQA